MAPGDLTATKGTMSEKQGAMFDGVDDYVEIPHDASQLGANLSNGFTISAWINPRSYGEASLGYIIAKDSGINGANGFALRVINNSGQKVFGFRINGGTERNSAGTIVLGEWQHILVTISSGQLANLYRNGALSGTANQDLLQTISTITTTNAMRIGNPSTTTDRTFDGSIRSVKMWNRVLTAEEISQDYSGIAITRGLILNVPLENDYSEKALNLTLTNSGSYLTNTLPNKITADVRQINLSTTKSKLIPIPLLKRIDKPTLYYDNDVKIIGVNRA